MSVEVVARAKAGDPQAWVDLHRSHGPRLLAWLRARPVDDAAICAEDLAAETWMVATAKIDDFEGDASQFGGWLFVIARHQMSTCRRRTHRRRTDAVEPRDLIALGGVPADDATDTTWLHRLLVLLPARERAAVALVDALGLDTAGAAEALGTTPAAVRVARHRGLKRLRAQMGTQHEGPRHES